MSVRPGEPLCDSRGLRLGTAVPAAADAVETALHRLFMADASPLPALEAAAQADPQWALPLMMRAGVQLAQADPALFDEARDWLERAQPLLAEAPARERGHWQALLAAAEGRWRAACQLWDDLLLAHPLDALALWGAHQADLVLGDAHHLRARPARVLAEWSSDDALYPHVLGLYAFGLAQDQHGSQAEEVARRALALTPDVPGAVHAVAHVMDLQGRSEDGTAWLRQHQAIWAEREDVAAHLWWHMGLFRLELMDLPGAHRLLDAHMEPAQLHSASQQRDAISLLWRMHLLGEEVGARFELLLRTHPPDEALAGRLAMHDVHMVLALVGADHLVQAERWVARCAQQALREDDARRSNHGVARRAGLPLMRGLLAMAHGDPDAATQLLRAALPQLPRLGGSAAQRDVFTLSLIVASSRTAHPAVGRALLNERRLCRADTPMTRQLTAWMRR